MVETVNFMLCVFHHTKKERGGLRSKGHLNYLGLRNFKLKKREPSKNNSRLILQYKREGIIIKNYC